MEEYPAPVQEQRIHPVKTKNTDLLLKEFNNVYDKVELTHLTPPDTPPQTPPQSFVDAPKVRKAKIEEVDTSLSISDMSQIVKAI